MEKEVVISLTTARWNTVLQALGNAPYVQVAEIIEEIRKQAAPQFEDPNSVEEKK